MNTVFAPQENTGAGLGPRTSGVKVETTLIPVGEISLPAELVVPSQAQGVVLFSLASGCVRESPQVHRVKEAIQAAGVATLTFPLLSEREAEHDRREGAISYDLELMTQRLLHVVRWTMKDRHAASLEIGLMGTGIFAAAALVAAATLVDQVKAVVARSGRPDFAGDQLERVTAPTLLIVGERDGNMVDLNERAYARLTCRRQLASVAGAGYLFEEAGASDEVGRLAATWFSTWLVQSEPPQEPTEPANYI